MFPRSWRVARLIGMSTALLGFSASPGHPQPVSAKDGFSDDGTYRVQVELTPYLWLPATSGSLKVGGNSSRGFDFDSGPPTLADLAHSLHGAFIGFGLLRYGPWSVELDTQWIDAFHKTSVPLGASPLTATLKDKVQVFRIAPGFGYQAYSGAVANIPATVDVRAGLSVFSWRATARIEESPLSGIGGNETFAQPWLGFRADFYPWQSWRLELGAMGEGFGVDGGVWGWGASALVTYSVNRWLDITGGFRAIASRGRGRGSGPLDRSIDITAYGPLLGVGVRF